MSDIKAGGAYIEVFAKEVLGPGLSAAKKKLSAFAKTVGTMGAGVLGGGVSLAAPLLAAVAKYTGIGDELANVNARTGASVEMLSSLSHAANLAGGSLADVQGGFRGMAKLAAGAAAGGKQANQVLSQLGISNNAFLAANPDQRMRMVADGLSKIHDPGLQAALAMQALGRGGMQLLPVLKQGAAGLDAMAAEAGKLGLVFTTEEIARADRLGDSIDTIKNQVAALFFQMGDALAPVLQPAIDGISQVLGAVINIIDQNPILVTTIAAVAGGMILAGSALLGVAGAATFVSFAITGLTTIITVCTAVIGFLLSPLGLIVLLVGALGVALVAGAGYFLMYTQTGRAAASILMAAFSGLGQFLGGIFQGIYDALAGGDLALAGQIAMAGLNVVFQAGLLVVRTYWVDFKTWLLSFLADMFDQALGEVQKFHSIFMATMNGMRGARGLAPIADSSGIGTLLSAGRAGAQGLRTSAAAAGQGELSVARTRLAGAQLELDALKAKAAEERKAANDKRRLKLGGIPELGSINPVAAPGGQALGTFSGAVAHMLGRSGSIEAAERTADATEEARDLLKDMEDDLSAIRDSGGGVAFV